MEKYSYCTSEKFKKDLSELCNKCPLRDWIMNGISNQILEDAKAQKTLLTSSQFVDYVNHEIESASCAMQRTMLIEKQNSRSTKDPHRKIRIQNYLWNKERIRALNRVLIGDEYNLQAESNVHKYHGEDHANIFSNNGFALFDFLMKNYVNTLGKGRFEDISYYYRMMSRDKYIHASIKDFADWYNINYEEIISKIKVLDTVKSDNRHRNYSYALESFKVKNQSVL